jgi:hypothetical protein
MVEIAEIVDRESFESWLEQEELPHEAMVVLAFRSAARAFPLLWLELGRKSRSDRRDSSNLLIFRKLLISCSFVRAQNASLRTNLAPVASANTRAYGVLTESSVTAKAADSARAAAASAANAAASAATAGSYAAYAASKATSAAGFASDAALVAWDAVRSDCNGIADRHATLSARLWPDGYNPLRKSWQDTQAHFEGLSDHPWPFWLDWYQRLLDGTEDRWDLLTDIALLDKDAEGNDLWKDPEKLAAEIARLEARYKLNAFIAAHPHAWRIELDHKLGLFNAQPVEQRDMSAIIADIRQSITDFHGRCRRIKVGNFGQATKLAFAPVISILRRDLKKYSDSPYSLFKAVELARNEMAEIAEVEGFAGESYINRFFAELDSHGEEICMASPEVVEQLKTKANFRFDISDLSRKRALATQTLSLHLDSEGMLKKVAFWALNVLQNPSASDEERKEAVYFCTAILPRAARAYLDDKSQHEEAATRDAPSLTTRAVEAADAISKLDRAQDALIELGTEVPQMADWVQSVIQGLPSP